MEPFLPMLAVRAEPFDADDYLFEVKWDGVRALAGRDRQGWWFCRQAGRCSTVAALGVGLAATSVAYAAGSGLAVPSLGLLTLASAVGAGAAALAWFGTS